MIEKKQVKKIFNNVLNDILNKKVKEELNKYYNSTKKYEFSVRVKQDYDYYDDYFDEVLNEKESKNARIKEALQKIEKEEKENEDHVEDIIYYKDYEDNTKKEKIDYKEIFKINYDEDFDFEFSFNEENSYFAFHYLIWEELSVEQKVIAIVSFLEEFDKNTKEQMDIFISDDYGEDIEFHYSKDANNFININPSQLIDSSGFEIMLSILNAVSFNKFYNKKKKYESGENVENIDLNLISNLDYRLELPDHFYSYNHLPDLPESEFWPVFLHAFQPIEVEFRKNLEKCEEFFEVIFEKIDLEDIYFTMFKDEYNALNKIFNPSFIKEFERRSKSTLKDIYADRFSFEINKIQARRNKNINKKAKLIRR
mgnify:CR=1 FL=1